ncbi:MAG: response regulator [Candidatus Cloacimonetes bacterium]|nr:response regulator [Candidatus Cloacimonadota bacterium]
MNRSTPDTQDLEMAVLVLNPDLRIRSFTPSIKKLFFLKEQDIGKQIEEIDEILHISPGLIEDAKVVLISKLAQAREVAGNNSRQLLQKIDFCPDELGEVQFLLVSFFAVDGLKEASSAKRKSDELRKSVMDALISNLCVLDREGNILEVNEGWNRFAEDNGASICERTGTGSNYLAVCRAAADSEESLDAKMAAEGISEVLSGSKDSFEMEYPCDSPEEMRWYLMRVTALKRPEGGAIVSHIDISFRKKAESAIRESEQRFRIMSDQAPVLIWMTDETGRGVFFNRLWFEFTNHTQEQDLLDGWQQFVHPEDKEELTRAYWNAIHNRDTIRHEFRFLHHISGYRWLMLVGVPRHGSQNDYLGHIGACSDITDLKRLENELRNAIDNAQKADAAKTIFLATMSHEIRTPLNAIIGMSSVLLDMNLNPEQTEIASIVHNNGESLLSLVSGILDYSKMEAGQVDLEHRSFVLERPILNAVEAVYRLAQNKGLRFSYIIDSELPMYVMGDSTRVYQVSLNLLSNALKFTKSGMVNIAVSASWDATIPMIQIRVTDTGVGIEEQAQKRIFEPFLQEDSSTTRNYGGTGLGLAICKKIVEVMGGRIWVSSQKGVGSAFFVEFPLIPAEVVQSVPDAQESILLLVEDPNQQITLRGQLKRLGYSILTSYTSDSQPVSAVIADGNSLAMVPQNLDKNLVYVLCEPGNQSRLDYDKRLAHPVRITDLQKILHRRNQEISNGSRPADGHEPGQILRILVVEDSAPNRRLMQIFLSQPGYQIECAVDGLQALEYLRTQAFDVVLLDIQMPGMDGITCAKEIAKMIPEPIFRPAIMAISANVFLQYRQACEEAGMSAFMAKPIRKEKLLQKITQLTPIVDIKPLINDMQGMPVHELKKYLVDLVTGWIRELHTLRSGFDEAASLNDSTKISAILHQIKGSAASLGMKRLAIYCHNQFLRQKHNISMDHSSIATELFWLAEFSANQLLAQIFDSGL